MSILHSLVTQGVIRQLDYQFARFIYRQSDDERLGFLSGVLSAQVGQGHSCLELIDNAGQPMNCAALLKLAEKQARPVSHAARSIDWQQVARTSECVGHPEQALPLILDGYRLYLQRYWHYEATLAQCLRRLAQPIKLVQTEIQVLATELSHLFPRSYLWLWLAFKQAPSDQQANAAFANNCCVIIWIWLVFNH